MSTSYLDCAICGQEIGSAHEMVVLKEGVREDASGAQFDVIEEAAHPDCYEHWQEAIEAEDAAEESEARARAQAEAEARWREESQI